MVNTGRPSRGCQTCKDKRIKCDLGQPECNRCLRTGRKCPGAITESDAALMSQNVYARTVKRKSKRALSASVESDSAVTNSMYDQARPGMSGFGNSS